MLSRFSRILTYFTALLYFVTGLILFILPARIAPVFAWKVTPFMTMTIGGWCLGNAWLAWMSARRWKWAVVYTSLTYLWLFGLIQTLVVIMFADKLALANPIAWLYLVTLGVNVLTAVVGLIDWTRLRPRREDLARGSAFSAASPRLPSSCSSASCQSTGCWSRTVPSAPTAASSRR